VADEATDRAIRELWLSKREAEEMERRSEQEVQVFSFFFFITLEPRVE